ncbi:glycosyltransferase family 2 protein [Thioclava sp. FR2]|uniref:glycosyltransferase family 2 protein n=1 Tax=Thioclava sp. FR2 TaxID=3445780 RepID=UPI003EB8E4DF
MKTLAVLTVRNEGAFLLEWLAHHKAAGFTDFLVFSNDCDDGTDRMLDRLAELGWLTHVPNPGPWEEGPQWSALKLADKHPALKTAEWVMVIDMDEFVNIKIGDKTLSALTDSFPDCDAFPMTWRMFGNAGVTDFEDLPVTEVFTRAAPRILHWPWRALMVKTLFRRDVFRKLGVHRPKGEKRPARWFDPNLGQRLFSAPGSDHYSVMQLNHYALGAMESYIVKCDRGRANRSASAFDMSYWCDRNFADEEDTSLQELNSSTIRQDLLADPVLQTLHQDSVIWRKARFAELMQEEPWRALFGRLMMTPPARILAPAEAQRIRQYRRD